MRRKGTPALAALTLAGALTLSACGSDSNDASSTASDGSTKLIVATTVSPLTSITSAVGGDLVTIEGIVPEGTNSHTFEPAPQTAELLSKADIVFVNGLKLEDPTIELAEANLKPGAEIVEIGTLALPESEYIFDFSFPEEEGKPNPHLWTDPGYAIEYADIVREVLSERDPANAEAFQANFDAFAVEAAKLDVAVRADQQTVPEGQLKLVTYHDAYAYFADNYGWEVVGAIQPDSFDDPSPAEVARLIEQIRAANVPVIFGSEVFPSAVLQAIGDEAGVRYEDSLRDDDLPGTPGQPEHSLLELLRYNYRTMITGLGGNPAALDAIVFVTPLDNAFYPQ
ncbi:MAG: metal ABC transporter substrate-binding protein [Candidatus Nanopelagicales bacterium]